MQNTWETRRGKGHSKERSPVDIETHLWPLCRLGWKGRTDRQTSGQGSAESPEQQRMLRWYLSRWVKVDFLIDLGTIRHHSVKDVRFLPYTTYKTKLQVGQRAKWKRWEVLVTYMNITYVLWRAFKSTTQNSGSTKGKMIEFDYFKKHSTVNLLPDQ